MSKSVPDVVQAIKLSEMAGRAVTDTEVAALAAGQLTITDLVVPMGVPEDVEGEAEEEEDGEEQGSVKEISLGEEEPAEDPESVKLRDDMEAEEEEDGEEQESVKEISLGEEEPAEDPENVKLKDDMEAEEEEDGEKQESVKEISLGEEEPAEDPESVKLRDDMEAEEEEDGEKQESVKEISLGEEEPAEDPESVKLRDDMEGDGWNEANKEKGNGEAAKPVIGERVVVQKGEDKKEEEDDEGSSSESDSPETPGRKMAPISFSEDEGEGDDDFIADGVPMTENEEIESILPLGEVSMNDTEVIPVGTILSLVEPDGTIVIRGNEGQPPLDEGSVLSAVAQDTDSKEPMGRIHEIFGPCKIPHYTVRVEGAATKYQPMKRNKRKEVSRHVQDARADDGDGGTAEAAAQEPKTSPSRTTHKDGENPNLNTQEELAARMSAAKEIEEKEHPFRRWKVGATVYVLKNHAKYLAKELLLPRGKGSDASNKHDEEAEEEYFSDDQEEKKAKVREKENRRRDALAMQGVLPHEIEATIAEEREKRIAKANRRDASGRGRGGRGRGGFRTEAGGARGVGHGGRGNRHYGGRIGPGGFPAWRASDQPRFGLNPVNTPMTMMPMPYQQQNMPPNQIIHPPQQPRNINGFPPGGQPLHGPMRQRDGYFPGRFNGPPPQQQFPHGQHMPNPSQFVQHHQQQLPQQHRFQLPQQPINQMSGVYGAQPVNPVVSPRPQGESDPVNNGNGPVEVRLPGLGHIRLSISPTVPQP